MRPALALTLILTFVAAARASGPADELLRLAPRDAAATLVVEDLRGRAGEVLGSPLVRGLGRLPAVRAWLDAHGRAQLEESRRDIEAALGVRLAEIRDGLLGDAVVLSLQIPAGAPAESGQGLLLTRVRDRKLLERLIAASNDSEKQCGNLLSVEARRHGSATYSVRTFRAGTKPSETYTILGDGTFGWSNSEALIRGVIDRQHGKAGLAAEPKFQKVRNGLPARPLASLFVDPRFLERAAAEKPKDAADDLPSALLGRYVAAIDYVGLALEWRDGPVLHVHEALDPGRLDASLKRWAARSGGPSALLNRLPSSALALAAGNVDFEAVAGALEGLIPDAERPRYENVLEVVRGVLLDRDPRREILPALGPGMLAYLDTPPDRGDEVRFPLVVVLGLGDDSGVAAALGNALRTVLALVALDPKQGSPEARVESRQAGAVRLTFLRAAKVSLAFAVDRGFLVLGTSPEAIAGYCTSDPSRGPGRRFESVRSSYFPDATTFAYADLESFHRWADAHRPALARRLAEQDGESPRDLDAALDLLHLFRAAFATSAIDPAGTSAHRTLGLIGREPSPK